MREFGKELIRVRRLELGISLSKLSRMTRIPLTNLSRLENGYSKKLSIPSMIKISQVLEIDLFKLLELDADLIVVSKYFYDLFVGNYIRPKN